MEKWPTDSRFQVTANTLVKSFDDKIALAHMQTKRFHLLNPTATRIWKSVSSGSSLVELKQQIRQEFDVDPEQLSASIDQILTTLNSENFIEIRS